MIPQRHPAHQTLAWLAVALYMSGIFYLSHQPSVPIPMRFPHQDKVMHFCAYFGLALVLAHTFVKGGFKGRFAFAFAMASVYGVTDEVHQAFVPGRDASVYDWLADTGGAWAGAFCYLRARWTRWTRKPVA